MNIVNNFKTDNSLMIKDYNFMGSYEIYTNLYHFDPEQFDIFENSKTKKEEEREDNLNLSLSKLSKYI